MTHTFKDFVEFNDLKIYMCSDQQHVIILHSEDLGYG